MSGHALLVKFTVILILISYSMVGSVVQKSQLLQFQGSPEMSAVSHKDQLIDAMGLRTIRQCGGTGKILKWRRESCEYTLKGPCALQVNLFTHGELSFVASSNSDSLGLNGKIMDKNRNELHKFNRPKLLNSSVEAGKEYHISADVAFGEDIRKKLITVQLILYREDNGKVEVCVEGDFIIV